MKLTKRQKKLLKFMKEADYHVIVLNRTSMKYNCQGNHVYKMDFNALLKENLIGRSYRDTIREYYKSMR